MRVFLSLLLVTTLSMASAKDFGPERLFIATSEGLPNCLQYQVKGLCYWLVGVPPETHVEASLYVSHFTPDVVVNVFANTKDDPYLLAKPIDALLIKLANTALKPLLPGGTLSGGAHAAARASEINVKLKDVNILPNPALALMQNSLFLKSPVSMGDIYLYHSIADMLFWRAGAGELASLSMLIQKTEIGDWGSLAPQVGTVNAANNYIDSAIIAFRAASLIDAGGPYAASGIHSVHRRLQYRSSHYNHSSHLVPNSKEITWQLIYPKLAKHCSVFGTPSVTRIHANDELVPARLDSGALSWLLWRKMTGCLPHEGAYLGKTIF